MTSFFLVPCNRGKPRFFKMTSAHPNRNFVGSEIPSKPLARQHDVIITIMDLLVRCLEQSSKHILSNGGAYDGDESPWYNPNKKNWPNKHKVVGNSSTENFGFRSKNYTIYHHINMGESFCFFTNLPCDFSTNPWLQTSPPISQDSKFGHVRLPFF